MPTDAAADLVEAPDVLADAGLDPDVVLGTSDIADNDRHAASDVGGTPTMVCDDAGAGPAVRILLI
jgi:hypothetical protein